MSIGRFGIMRSVVAALALGALVTAASCNDDPATDESSKPTSTVAETTTSLTVPPSTGLIEITTTTADPTQFGLTIADVRSGLEAAGTDLCKIAEATSTLNLAGSPTTTADVQAFFTLYGEVFNKIADALPDDSADDAQTIRDGVTEMLAKAAASSYDPTSLTGGLPPGLDTAAFGAAMERVDKQMTEECPGTGPGDDAPTTTEG